MPVRPRLLSGNGTHSAKKPASQAEQELFAIADRYAVATLAAHYLPKEKDPAIRRLYIDAIGRIPTRAAQNVLVEYAIIDKDESVRERAATLLLNQKQYDLGASIGPLALQLQHKQNRIVRRAGTLLGQTNSPAAVLPLMDSVVTTHKIRIGGDANRTQAGFARDGSTSFNPGGGGPKEVTVNMENEEVLDALRTITGEDFGFDHDAWLSWYIENHTITDYDFRRDE